MTWAHQLSVDHSDLDHDHRILFNLANGLHAMRSGHGRPEDLSFVVSRLERTLIHHFASEERYLATNGYPHLAAHQREHQALLHSFNELKSSISGYRPAVRGRDATNAVLSFLHEVTVNHVRTSDLRYRDFFRESRICG